MLLPLPPPRHFTPAHGVHHDDGVGARHRETQTCGLLAAQATCGGVYTKIREPPKEVKADKEKGKGKEKGTPYTCLCMLIFASAETIWNAIHA